MKPDLFRIPADYVEGWLRKHQIRWTDVERGAPIWPVDVNGVPQLIPLDPEKIERLIAVEDRVIWAWLYLTERMTVVDEDAGTVAVRRGDPWSLFPVQAELARLEGNVIAECAAEVGKTRDIVLQILHAIDTGNPGDLNGVATNKDSTAKEIWGEIEYQVEQNPAIGGGLRRSSVKPYREMEFNGDTRFQMRLAGSDGEQFRGWHVNGTLTADEVAKWKADQQWSEFWRAGMPGSHFRLYTTPDGDYSSPYFKISARARALNGQNAELSGPIETGGKDEPRFVKLWIAKKHLPAPFYSERRLAAWRHQYGAEHTVRYLNNVLGVWGTPSQSVFPDYMLRPARKPLEHYRIAVCKIDRQQSSAELRAARFAGVGEPDAGTEVPFVHERLEIMPGDDGRELASRIGQTFPTGAVRSWTDPELFCGGDLGSATDPSEFVFVRKVGEVWTDVYRLHLSAALWPEQAAIVMRLDHESGHRVRYGFDAGSAGSALVQVLTEVEQFRLCPICALEANFRERIRAFNFGSNTDEIDEKGNPVLDPDRRSPAGDLLPYRISNKEFSTRILERKLANVEIVIANDRGAGDESLAGPQLLTNHTSRGEKSKRGERKFKEEDDHHVDARRQIALVILSAFHAAPFVEPDPDDVVTTGARASASYFAGEDRARLSDLYGPSSGSRPFAGGGDLWNS